MADLSVRPALPSDAEAVARVQLTTWRAAYADVLPAEALEVDPAAVAAAWEASVASPPTPRHRLLVALDGSELVGLAASEPTDDGAELTELLVEPRWGRRGHGSRLLAATVDLWRQDGVTRATTWVLEDDAVLSAFLASAGWGPETVGRTGTVGTREVRQRRWHTALD